MKVLYDSHQVGITKDFMFDFDVSNTAKGIRVRDGWTNRVEDNGLE